MDIKITDTENSETTLEAILADYPDAVCYDAGGFEIDLTDDNPWDTTDARGGRVALIWANEIDSEGNDGSYAIAEVTEVPEEHTYAVVDDDDDVVVVYTSELTAGDGELVDHMDALAENHGETRWVYVEETCSVGDRLDVDDDGCATVHEAE